MYVYHILYCIRTVACNTLTGHRHKKGKTCNDSTGSQDGPHREMTVLDKYIYSYISNRMMSALSLHESEMFTG